MTIDQELLELKKLLEMTYQTGRVGCFEWDLKSGEYLLSPGLEQLYGLQPGGFGNLNGSWWEALHPEDRETARKVVEESFNSGAILSNEFRVLWPDGSVHWLSTMARTIRDEEGQPYKMYGVNVDITSQKQAEERAVRESQRFLTLIEKSSSGILLMDLKGRVISYGYAVLGYGPEDKVGENILSLVHPEDRAGVLQELKYLSLNPGSSKTSQYRALHKNGTWRWIESVSTDMTQDPNIRSIVVNYRDVTERKEAEKIIRDQATKDSLTGILNRKAFKDLLEETLQKAKKSKGSFTVMFLDLDRFKNVNDTLGHEIGDLVLEKVTSLVCEAVKGIGDVGRLGGDEFGIVLFNMSETDEVQKVAKRILKCFVDPIRVENNTLFIEASIGITTYPRQGAHVNDLLRNADIALYKAKDEGRNNFRFYHDGMIVSASRKIILEQKLREAIKNKRLFLEYQPIVDLQTGMITSMEALMRWSSEEGGIIYPNQFIPLAEETGLIRHLGKWLIDEVIRQLTEWQIQGIQTPKITVNVSSFEFMDYGFARKFVKILKRAKIDTKCIELEITETTAMRDMNRTRDKLDFLSKSGINIIMDDFGTGYSSLGYLRRFPLQKLKIDKSFINNCTRDEQDGAIVRAIISMAHSLNLQVVAEGIETSEQLEFVRAYGCDYGQGFLLGKPQEAHQVEKRFAVPLPI